MGKSNMVSKAGQESSSGGLIVQVQRKKAKHWGLIPGAGAVKIVDLAVDLAYPVLE